MLAHSTRRVALAVAVVALVAPAALVAATSATAPVQAAPPSYVALGDSYASGLGTRAYTNQACKRSRYAYPRLVADRRGYALTFRACTGAEVPDVRGQLGALGPGTDYVTVQVGGNDAGFVDVITECAQPWWSSSCNRAVDGARAFIRNRLPGRLAGLYDDIDSRASSAEVVVVGYPRLFMGEDCNAGTFFSPAEQTRLNNTADLLNSRIAGAARAAGFDFANPTSRFVGHAVCDEPEWVNGLSYPVAESYHPNRLGHSSGYTALVSGIM